MATTRKMTTRKMRFRPLRLARLLVAALSTSAVAAQPILAQTAPIVADPSAQGGLNVQTAPNGVPLVDIARPNERGLSHNKYVRFDVGEQGAILNNRAETFGPTELGGMVQGNPNLVDGAARVILNEVTSADRSELEGIVEVAGQSAEVILANPYGITCDGCGFIRIPRVTLTTGSPEIAEGALTGFAVTGGDIRFGENGADLGSVGVFDIVSRRIAFGGTVEGLDVRVVAGPNRFDYATGATELLPGDRGTAPTYAIDGTALGGLRAGKILLLSTENGVGVRAPAEMAAHAGEMTLTADGRLVLGRASSRGRATVRSVSGGVEIEGSLFSEESVEVTGESATLAKDAALASAGDLEVVATTISLGGDALVAAGMTGEGELEGDGTLTLTATGLTASDARLAAAGDARISADAITLDRTNSGEALTVLGDAIVKTGSISATGATLSVGGDLTATTDGDLEATDDDGDMKLTGGSWKIGGDANLEAGSLVATADLATTGSATLTTREGDLSLRGDLETGGAVVLESAGDLTLAKRLASGGTGDLTAAGDMDATGTTVVAGDLTASAANLDNDGAFGSSGGKLTIRASGDVENDGLLYAGTDMSIRLDGDLENRRADIVAEGGIEIRGLTGDRAASVLNESANIEAIGGDLRIAATSATNGMPAPKIVEVTEVVVLEGEKEDFPDVSHPGNTNRVVETTTTTRQEVEAPTDPAETSSPSRMVAGGDIEIEADDIVNRYSLIAANGDVTLTADMIDNTGRDLIETVVTETVSHYSERYCARRFFGACISRKTRHLTRTNESTESATHQSVYATIQAGGKLTANVSGYLSNEAVRQGVAQIGLASGERALEKPGQVGTVDPETVLGRSAIFQPTGSPDAPFLIETRPEFVDPNRFLSSDYFLNQIGGYDANIAQRRFGDAHVEARLVQEQLFALTGRRQAGDPDELRELMRRLYDNALDAAEALEIAPGVSLAPEQVAALTGPIIWLEARVVRGEEVLVPVVYLAGDALAEVDLASARIEGGEIDVDAGRAFNSGAIGGEEAVAIATEGEFLNVGGRIVSDGDVALEAGGTLANISGRIAGENVTIEAEDVENSLAVVRDATGQGYADRIQDVAIIAATGDLSIAAEDDLTAEGGRFEAGGDAALRAGDDIDIVSATVETLRDERFAEGRDTSYSLTNELAGVTAGGELTIEAGDDLTVAGAEIEAGGDATLAAGGDVEISSVQDVRQDDYSFEASTGGLFGTTTTIRRQSSEVATVDTTVSAGGNLTVRSETGDVTLQAPSLASGGETEISAEKGRVALLTNEDSAYEREERREEDLLWWNYEDKGFSETTRTPTRITAEGGLQIVSDGEIVAEYVPTGGDFDAGIEQLSKSPGLEWMADLRDRDDVAWREARVAFEEWDYEQQGLTEAGALLVSVIASYALGPGIEALAGDLAAKLGGGSALEAALRAALSSLSNQAAISLIANRGDLGAVLKELAAEGSVRSLITAMVSAGLSTKLTVEGGILGELPKGNDLTTRIARELKRELVQSSVDTALDVVILGQDLDEALAGNLRGAAAAAIGTVAAQRIGEAAGQGDIDRATQLIAHAALGCAVGAVGSDDCNSGAIGALSGEIAALIYTDAALRDPKRIKATLERWEERGLAISEIVGGLLAAAAGGSANVGADAGRNAAENNAFWIPFILIALYLTYEGEGDIAKGLIAVGRGEDIVSKLLELGAETAIAISSHHFPGPTAAVLGAAEKLGELSNIAVIYIDDATGNKISKGWNQLPPDVQDAILGGLTVATILVPAGVGARIGQKLPGPGKPIDVSGVKIEDDRNTPTRPNDGDGPETDGGSGPDGDGGTKTATNVTTEPDAPETRTTTPPDKPETDNGTTTTERQNPENDNGTTTAGKKPENDNGTTTAGNNRTTPETRTTTTSTRTTTTRRRPTTTTGPETSNKKNTATGPENNLPRQDANNQQNSVVPDYSVTPDEPINLQFGLSNVDVKMPDLDVSEYGVNPKLRDRTKHHENIRKNVISQLKKLGLEVEDRQPTFGSASGGARTRPDIMARTQYGDLVFIEIKTGNASLSPNQTELYPKIKSGEAIPYGQVADEFKLDIGERLDIARNPENIHVITLRFPRSKNGLMGDEAMRLIHDHWMTLLQLYVGTGEASRFVAKQRACHRICTEEIVTIWSLPKSQNGCATWSFGTSQKRGPEE